MLSASWSRWHANVANLGGVNVCGWEPRFQWDDTGFGGRQRGVGVLVLLLVSSVIWGQFISLPINQVPEGKSKLNLGGP